MHKHYVPRNGATTHGDKVGKVGIVNAIGTDALVVGSPNDVAQIGEILPLPNALNQSVARG